MTDEAREARKAYWREYYRTHKAQHRRTMEKYWQKRADAAKAQREAEAQTDAPAPDAAAPTPAGESANGANEKVTK